MSNKFGITDSLLDAVKGVSSQRVGQYTLGGINEAKNAPSKENGGIAHMCASHVQHATYGEGVCIPEQHTIVESAPGEGYVSHYDVDFSGNIVENVPVEDLEIVKESSHMHSNVKKDKKMIAGQKMDEMMSSKEKMKRGLYNGKMDPVGKADADIDNDGDVDKSDSYLKNRRKAISKSMGKNKVKMNPEVKEEYTHDDFKKDRIAKVKSTGATGRVVARYRHDDGEIHYTLNHGGDKTSRHPGKNLQVHESINESMDKAKDAAFDHSSDEPVHLHSKGTSHVFSGNKATGHKDVKGAPRMQDDKVHYIHHDTSTGKSSTFKIPAGKTTAAKVKRHMPAGAHHAAADVAHDHNSMHEETKVDSGLENPHNCATHVYSESWGDGKTVPTMHADPDEMGNVAWYDVMFEHGVEKGVPIEELKVLKSSQHGHKKRGSK